MHADEKQKPSYAYDEHSLHVVVVVCVWDGMGLIFIGE